MRLPVSAAFAAALLLALPVRAQLFDVDLAGTPRTGTPGALEGTAPGQTCTDLGGSCCAAGQTCTGSWQTGASDCASCCDSTCERVSTCSDLGGQCCASWQSCGGSELPEASDCALCCESACQGDRPTIVAPYLTAPVAVDGDLSEYADATPITVTVPSTGAVLDLRIAWSDDAMFVGAAVADAALNATLTARDSGVYAEDSVEMMFDTLADGGSGGLPNLDDYKLMVSALGTQTDARGGGGWEAWNTTWQAVVVRSGTVGTNTDTDQGYTVEISVAWADWGVSAPSTGQTWGFDVALNDRTSPTTKDGEPFANLDGGTINDPDGWGRLVFGPPVSNSDGGPPDDGGHSGDPSAPGDPVRRLDVDTHPTGGCRCTAVRPDWMLGLVAALLGMTRRRQRRYR